ncbi:MAG: hypothetical protein J6333_03540 [Planctomycetes bacterium]|nr:hypothetical protein [Planctomycetota bacterium]
MRMKLSLLLAVLCLPLAAARAGESPVVKKALASYDAGQWTTSVYRNVAGEFTPGKSLECKIKFAGEGFSAITLAPAKPLTIPGVARKVSLRVCSPKLGFSIKFKDGWGREEVDGRKFEFALGETAPDEWVNKEFAIPGDWVMPLQLVGFVAHNWGRDSEKIEMDFAVADLTVETDLSDVDRETGQLRGWKPAPSGTKNVTIKESPKVAMLTADVGTSALSNVYAGEDPELVIAARNWLPGSASCSLSWELRPADAKEVLASGKKDIQIVSLTNLKETVKIAKFGRYQVDAALKLPGGKEIKKRIVLAKLPAPAKLTPEQKMLSPYGMNIHSGKPNGDLKGYLPPYMKAGVVWFRDYSWSYGFTTRSKGDDGKFMGWPYHGVVYKQAKDMGIMLLPCMAGSIQSPLKDGDKVSPAPISRDWTQHLTFLFNAFPDLKYWELDNEYDLHPDTNWGENARREEKIGWKNYQQYHKKFAGILDTMYDGEVQAVENGRAGIHPEKVEACVKSGAFANVKVVNSHHYCGVDAPETNLANSNTGGGGDTGAAITRTFFDMLRDASRAARADGAPRQHWLTEFGWDTLAGKVVSPYEQAVYLPRGWMVAMAAGCQKSFWFFDEDSPTPNTFFDGCGLLGPAPEKEPKLALCALAGMTHLMPTPQYVGSLYAGDGTQGYLFKQDGKNVAALWSVAADQGPEIDAAGAKAFDFLANPLPGGKTRLSRAPVYLTGLPDGHPLYLQTAYEIDSRHVEAAAGGDTLRPVVKVVNNRKAPIACAIRAVLPKGWSDATKEAKLTVAPGEAKTLEMTLKVAEAAETGSVIVKFVCEEGGKRIKEMPLLVQLVTPAVQVTPLGNQPGEKEVTVSITNTTKRPISGKVTCKLPAAWKCLTPEVAVPEIAPLAKGEVKVKLNWNNELKDGETAILTFKPENMGPVTQPLIPGFLKIFKAGQVKVDGNLGDWDAKHQVPQWLLGCTAGRPQAKAWLAWSPDGIYGALEVKDSRILSDSPKDFWTCDCLELFLDAANSKQAREFQPTDHQFWLVPLKDGKAYCGRWKRKNEIPATVYGVPGAKGVTVAKDGGYVMEFLIPAKAIQGYQPGKAMGVNFNLTVKGKTSDREVFWPAAKSWAVQNQPQSWGSVTLAE